MFKDCVVDYQKEISPGIFVMTLNVDEMAEEVEPGQFVMIKSWQGSDPFLMRPISINSVDRKGGIMTLLYTVKGKGTKLLSELGIGDLVQVLGPLGTPFPLIEEAKRVALIGRGIGIAPLLQLAQDYIRQGTEVYVYLSAKQESHLFNKDAFEYLGAKVRTTVNSQEVITDLMADDCRDLSESGEMPFDAAYSCGSNRLARGMQALHKEYGFPAYVSLEQHMACGIGACKGCVCTAKEEGSDQVYYPRVCKEGPVFDVDRIYFDD